MVVILGLGGIVEPAMAATLQVSTCNDGYDPLHMRATWLRQQVAAASSGDVIDMTGLTCSTITLTHGAIPIGVANLEIDGPSNRILTIDGNEQDRVFSQTAAGGQLLLSNLTITRGMTSGSGGCIQSAGTVHLFDSVTVTGCSAGVSGGGITAKYVQTNHSTISYNSGGGIASLGARTSDPDVYIVNTAIIGNTGGAGVFGSDVGSIVIKSSQINYNTSPTCGGISAGDYYAKVKPSSVLTMSYSSVSGNTGGYDGGICAGAVYLLHTTISSNQGKTGGGIGVFGVNRPFTGTFDGVNFASYDLVAVDSTIADNNADYGGGIYTNGATAIIGSTISGNASTASGSSALIAGAAGGISTYDGVFVNSTVSGNLGQTTGALSAAVVKLFNTTVAFNASGNVGQQYPGGIKIGGIHCSANCSPAITLNSSIVAKNVSGVSNAESDISLLGDATVSASNSLIMFSSKPTSILSADPLLLPLANNGGPVQTHALRPASPALGAGSNPLSLPYDERGYPFERSWVNGQTDIGAFQTQDGIFYNGFE